MTAIERLAIAAAVPPRVIAMDQARKPVTVPNAEIRRNLGWGLIESEQNAWRLK